MKRFHTLVLLSPIWLLTSILTVGCGSDLEPAPQLDASTQAEIAAEDAQVETEEMQQRSQ